MFRVLLSTNNLSHWPVPGYLTVPFLGLSDVSPAGHAALTVAMVKFGTEEGGDGSTIPSGTQGPLA